jgi:hypothetical protein
MLPPAARMSLLSRAAFAFQVTTNFVVWKHLLTAGLSDLGNQLFWNARCRTATKQLLL